MSGPTGLGRERPVRLPHLISSHAPPPLQHGASSSPLNPLLAPPPPHTPPHVRPAPGPPQSSARVAPLRVPAVSRIRGRPVRACPLWPPSTDCVADQGNPPLTTRSAFIKSSYPAVKKANPDLPILIREANGTPARGFVRFGASPCFPPRALCSYLRSRGSARGEEGALAPFGWREGTWWPSGLAASVGRSMP